MRKLHEPPRATVAKRAIETVIPVWHYEHAGILLDTSDIDTATNLASRVMRDISAAVFISRVAAEKDHRYFLSRGLPQMMAGDLKANYVRAVLPQHGIVDDLNLAYRSCLQLYKFSVDGCLKGCPYGPEKCLDHLLPHIGSSGTAMLKTLGRGNIVPSTYSVGGWDLNRSRASNRVDTRETEGLISYLKGLEEDDLLTYVSPAFTEVNSFTELLRYTDYVSFSVYDEAKEQHRIRALNSGKSRKYGLEHCRKCILDCHTQDRKYCYGEELLESEIRDHVISTVKKVWGGLPAWNNKGLQAALCLQGTQFKYKERYIRGQIALRGTRSVIAKILPPGVHSGAVWPDTANRILRSEGTPEYAHIAPSMDNLVAYIIRDWGSDRGYSKVPLKDLIKDHPKLAGLLGTHTPIPTSEKTRSLFLFMSLDISAYRPGGGFGGRSRSIYSIKIKYGSPRGPYVSRELYPGGIWYAHNVADYKDLHDPPKGVNLYEKFRRNYTKGPKW